MTDSEIDWEALLAKEGMPARLPKESGKVRIGLGVKSDAEERAEDNGRHSFMCPLNLGIGLDDEVNQTNDRPVENRKRR